MINVLIETCFALLVIAVGVKILNFAFKIGVIGIIIAAISKIFHHD